MKTYRYCLLISISSLVFSNTWAQVSGEIPQIRSGSAQSPTRNVQEATSETGTILKKDIRWTSKVPLNKTYGQLNEAQKAELHKMYESMPAGDEPSALHGRMADLINLQKRLDVTLQEIASTGQVRVLIKRGIVELPSAGYLPIELGQVTVNEQVRRLLGFTRDPERKAQAA